MKKILILLIVFAVSSYIKADEISVSQTVLQGKICAKTGEPLVGVNLYFPDLKTGTVTNLDGFYKIDNLPKRTLQIQINSVGYKMIMEKINLATTHQKDY